MEQRNMVWFFNRLFPPCIKIKCWCQASQKMQTYHKSTINAFTHMIAVICLKIKIIETVFYKMCWFWITFDMTNSLSLYTKHWPGFQEMSLLSTCQSNRIEGVFHTSVTIFHCSFSDVINRKSRSLAGGGEWPAYAAIGSAVVVESVHLYLSDVNGLYNIESTCNHVNNRVPACLAEIKVEVNL